MRGVTVGDDSAADSSGPVPSAADSPEPLAAAAAGCDAVIIGGGLVGGALALALAAEGVRAAVVEATPADDAGQASFDARNVALTEHARRLFARLGAWDDIAPAAQAIVDIHISERGGFGMTHLNRAHVGDGDLSRHPRDGGLSRHPRDGGLSRHPRDGGLSRHPRSLLSGGGALGFVAPTRVIGRALHRRLHESPTVDFYCPARAVSLRQGAAAAEVDIEFSAADSAPGESPKSATLTAPLVVLADGGRSPLAAQAGLPAADPAAYRHAAIACVVASDRAHGGRAFERFTAEGPLALLPHRAHARRGFAVVWASAPANAARRMALSDADFAAELQEAFGDRAGNFHSPSARARYPLRFGARANPAGRRAVSIGNAAHTVHPVAAQGLNLGLRDAVVLAAALARAKRAGRDPGGATVLAEYAALRRRETARVGAFTDGLIRVFGARSAAVRLARNLGLAGLEVCPPAKKFLLRRATGASAMRGIGF